MSQKRKENLRIDHPFPPLYDQNAEILILGSFPSVKSREEKFFYGHPQNRFWKTVAGVLSEPVPKTIEEKKNFLYQNHIALWDVIGSCEIVGSSDSSIKNVIPNDLSPLFDAADIKAVFCNGAKAFSYYETYQEKETGIKAIRLPSTSPANAAYTPKRLTESWKVIGEPLKAAPAGIGQVLLHWYDYHARVLPWRSDPSPYHVWISEIMLQQTRVEAAKRYYERWMEELPDIRALAEVEEDRLLKLWEGLGYYNRARNLKAAAKTVMERYGGALPNSLEALLSLKGIGEYTAGAIASIAFGLPKPAVDTNVMRVFARLLMLEEDVGSQPAKKKVRREVERILPGDRPGDFNQALMDLGASLCLPHGAPLCGSCPWEAVCLARRNQKEEDYPLRREKRERRIEEKTVFLLEWEPLAPPDAPFKEESLNAEESLNSVRKMMLHRRPAKGLLPSLWEFPNIEGRCTPKEARQQIDTWFSGLDFVIESAENLGEAAHTFTHVKWQMTGFRFVVKTAAGAPLHHLLEKRHWILDTRECVREQYAIPSAFAYFKKYMDIKKQ